MENQIQTKRKEIKLLQSNPVTTTTTTTTTNNNNNNKLYMLSIVL